MSQPAERRIGFLRDALGYVEHRIEMLDQMWPSAEITENVAEYLSRVDSLTDEEIVLNLAKTHHNSLVMVEGKYRFYRRAVRGMHAVIILSFTALAWAFLIKVI